MSLRIFKEIKIAISHLNPGDVRETVERPVSFGLVASSAATFAEMEDFLAPAAVSDEKRMEVLPRVHRIIDPGDSEKCDVMLYEPGLPCPADAFTFYRENPEQTVREILENRQELALPLARAFFPFRRPVVDRVIQSVSKENALFAVLTAMPNIIPNLLEFPWAVGEVASDTAFLTMNQIRMAFLIAGASDKPIGYREQKGEIASIITSAFGWRALARELAGKIPMGGGLIPKGAIAFAGTYVVGLGLERLHRIGYGLSRRERKAAYYDAFERGKRVTEAVLNGLKRVRSPERRLHAT